MWARLSIVAGLVIGVAVAGLLLGGILAFVPDRPLPPAATPSTPVATVAPSPTASAVPGPSAARSPVPSAAPSPVPSASAAVALFHIGRPAPTLVVPKVGGGTVDLATLPGVDVQP